MGRGKVGLELSRPFSPIIRHNAKKLATKEQSTTPFGSITTNLVFLLVVWLQSLRLFFFCPLTSPPLTSPHPVKFDDWIHMINDLEENYAKYDAFVIIHGTQESFFHGKTADLCLTAFFTVRFDFDTELWDVLIWRGVGTDTMAYTASGLSFLIENLGKTIIITGAQLPLAVPDSHPNN